MVFEVKGRAVKQSHFVWLWLVVLICAGCATKIRGNQVIESFERAKKHVYALHTSDPRTLYCNCAFEHRRIIEQTCAFEANPNKKRDLRTEIEHIVPMKRLGGNFPSWRNGHPHCINSKGRSFKGRRCARKVSRQFRLMEADLHNLYPAIGTLNQRRGTKSFGEVPGEARVFGHCDFEVEDVVEPRVAIRGEVARAYLYMAWAYPSALELSPKEQRLFSEWSKSDPATAAERRRNAEIQRIQRNEAPVW